MTVRSRKMRRTSSLRPSWSAKKFAAMVLQKSTPERIGLKLSLPPRSVLSCQAMPFQAGSMTAVAASSTTTNSGFPTGGWRRMAAISYRQRRNSRRSRNVQIGADCGSGLRASVGESAMDTLLVLKGYAGGDIGSIQFRRPSNSLSKRQCASPISRVFRKSRCVTQKRSG